MMPALAAEPYKRGRSSPASATDQWRSRPPSQQRARRGHVLADDPACRALPLAEEPLEHRVQEAPALQRRRRVFVLRLFFERQHFGREELEWALQVAIDSADADPRKYPRAGLAQKRGSLRPAEYCG